MSQNVKCESCIGVASLYLPFKENSCSGVLPRMLTESDILGNTVGHKPVIAASDRNSAKFLCMLGNTALKTPIRNIYWICQRKYWLREYSIPQDSSCFSFHSLFVSKSQQQNVCQQFSIETTGASIVNSEVRNRSLIFYIQNKCSETYN